MTNIKIDDTQTLNKNTCTSINQCTIALLHDTPLTSNEALFKAFHLINKEWPLANSGALLQRLKLIGSSQNLLNFTTEDVIISDNNIHLKEETEISINNKISPLNNIISSSNNKSDFQLIFKNIPKYQLPCRLPFSVVAYIEIEEEKSNYNDNNSSTDKNNKHNKTIKIIGHSRWALAKPVLLFNSSNNTDTNTRQVLMDSLVVDKDYRNYGIGKAILLYGEEILKRMKINQIYLQTKHAKNFYLKYGYKESKIIPSIKVEKKIYNNVPLDTNEVDKLIENELALNENLKPRPFNFSNAVWMEKEINV